MFSLVLSVCQFRSIMYVSRLFGVEQSSEFIVYLGGYKLPVGRGWGFTNVVRC